MIWNGAKVYIMDASNKYYRTNGASRNIHCKKWYLKNKLELNYREMSIISRKWLNPCDLAE